MQTIKLDEWQREFLEYTGDSLVCTGRRVGKTQIHAIKAIEFMIKKRKQVVVVSLTEDQAMLIISMATEYARMKYPGLIGKKADKPTLKTLTLVFGKDSKALMIARPVGATGDAVRGFKGGVLIVDEAARMPELFWIAAKPILLTEAGYIWMCSTPKGKQGYFWERFNESYNEKMPDARFKVFYTTTPKVMEERELSPSWTQEQREGSLRMLELDKREMSEIEYGKEYLGLFLDDLLRFFPEELINKCCIRKRPEIIPQGKKYLGVDLARMGHDESTFEIVLDDGTNVFKHICNETTSKTITTETEAKIIAMAEQYNVRLIGIDAGAGTLGVSVLDHLRQTRLRHKLLALNNREIALDDEGKDTQKILKEDLYFNLRGMMERGEIELLDDTNLRISLSSIQFSYDEKETSKTKEKNLRETKRYCRRIDKSGLVSQKGKIFKVVRFLVLMDFAKRYTTSERIKEDVKEQTKKAISEDAFAIGEMIEKLINKIELVRLQW